MHVWLHQTARYAVGNAHTEQCREHYEDYLRRFLVVLEHKYEEHHVEWYPRDACRQREGKLVYEDRPAAVEQQEQLLVELYELLQIHFLMVYVLRVRV